MADNAEVNVQEVVDAAEAFAAVVEKNLAAARASARPQVTQALNTIFRGGKSVASVLGSAISVERQHLATQANALKATEAQVQALANEAKAAVKPEVKTEAKPDLPVAIADKQ